MICVSVTPRSEIRNTMQEIANKKGIKIRIVEKVGKTLKNTLQKSNPFPNTTCNCMICQSGQVGTCRKQGVIYQIECERCGDIYTGETARNGYTRVDEHMSMMINKNEESVLLKHMKIKHPNEETPKFSAKIVKSYKHNSLKRQVAEGVHIRHNRGESMNSCLEFNTPLLPALSLNNLRML